MTEKHKITITILCVSALLVASWWFFLKNGDDDMITACAKNHDEMKEIELFPSDTDVVERRWGVPIPDDSLLIGGYDHFSWARICRDDSDPEGIYRGEYIDGVMRYSGTFRYVHPEGKSIPERIFEDFHMALIEAEGIRFHQNSPNPPIEYFHMMPTHPENVQWAEY